MKPLPQDKEQEMIRIFRDICKRYDRFLTGDATGQIKQEVKITRCEISFNGWPVDQSCETLYLDWNDPTFNFCKTSSRPYDEAVMEILLVYKFFRGDRVEVRSDGFFRNDDGTFNLGPWADAVRRVWDNYRISSDWLTGPDNYTACNQSEQNEPKE